MGKGLVYLMIKQYGLNKKKCCTLLFFLTIGICMLCAGQTAYAGDILSLSGELSGYQSVLLKWESEGVDSVYRVEKSKSSDGVFTPMPTVSGQTGAISFCDYDVIFGKTYYYKVVKLVENQVTEESKVIKVKITLSKPLRVKVKKEKRTNVKLSWDKVDGATGYIIYRSKEKSRGFKKIGSVTGKKFIDKSVTRGDCYYYKVAGIKKKVTGKSSEIVSVCMKPGAPRVNGQYIGKKIKLTWKKIKGADTYYIYKKNTKRTYKKLGETEKLYYTDKKVKKGKSYEYKVVAAYKRDKKVVKSDRSKVCKVLASGINPKKKMIALTFDDGPGKYTMDIVSCLKRNHTKATFFVIGSQIDTYKSSLQTADKIGCEIGNHTYDHSDLTKLSTQEIQNQIGKTDKKIKNAIGKSPTLMRTPGGAVNNMVNQTVAKPIILWSIDTRDWETRDREKTIKAVMSNVKDGDIILMHDIYKPTKEAACTLIVRLQREGYQLVTVSELAKYRGYKLKKGSVYRSLRRK